MATPKETIKYVNIVNRISPSYQLYYIQNLYEDVERIKLSHFYHDESESTSLELFIKLNTDLESAPEPTECIDIPIGLALYKENSEDLYIIDNNDIMEKLNNHPECAVDNLKPGNFLDSVDTILDVRNAEDFNSKLANKLQTLRDVDENKDKYKIVHLFADTIDFNYELEEKEFIEAYYHIQQINYIGGNLRISVSVNSIRINLNRNSIFLDFVDQSGLNYMSDVYIENSNPEDEMVNINFLSEIKVHLSFRIAKNMKLNFNSIILSEGGSVIALEPDQLTYLPYLVKDVRSQSQQAYLYNAHVSGSITIDVGSSIDLENVEFEENSRIIFNYDPAQSYLILNIDEKTQVVPIELHTDPNSQPYPDQEYTIILFHESTDSKKCNSWAEKIDLTHSKFNDIKCDLIDINGVDGVTYQAPALKAYFKEKSGGTNVGLIVGVVVAVVVVIAIVVVVVIIILKKKKNKGKSEGEDDGNANESV